MHPEDVTRSVLDELTTRSGELRRRAEKMQAELAAIEETVRSADGFATVVVGAGGVLRDVRIGAGSAATPERIRRSLMTAYREGCQSVGRRAAEVTERFAPGSPAVAMMRDAVPPDLEPDAPAGTVYR